MPNLSRSYCVEVLGGKTATIFEQGQGIPARRSQVFSTAEDGQHAIEIHILRGDAKTGSNESYAKYLIHQVPEGPHGTAKIVVQFDVEFHENLWLKAFNQSTDKELPVRLQYKTIS